MKKQTSVRTNYKDSFKGYRLVVAISFIMMFAILSIAFITRTHAASTELATASDAIDTPYGAIGKWMLASNGQVSNYGGAKYQNKTLLEAINVIIVDPTSKSPTESTTKLNNAMNSVGFPSSFGHTTGFKGMINKKIYTQQPTAWLDAYSDNAFWTTNNHGRIFGPAVAATGGYVYSGSFSTEVPSWFWHVYTSSNVARDTLANKFATKGFTKLPSVDMANDINTASTSTGDHDGIAVVIKLK